VWPLTRRAARGRLARRTPRQRTAAMPRADAVPQATRVARPALSSYTTCGETIRHVGSSRPCERINKDKFYWGTLNDVRKIYVRVAVHVFCSAAFAKVYTSKMPIATRDLLYERVLPF
jgi:hypothetical protein